MDDTIPPAAHTNEVLYVGGEAITDTHGTEYYHGQIYVEHLTPIKKPLNPQPIICIPGGGRTGIDFLPSPALSSPSTSSWSSLLLSHCYDLYLIDPPFRGRSPVSPLPLSYATFPPAKIKSAWSSAQLPDRLTMNHILASTHPQLSDLAHEQRLSQKGCVELLERISQPAFLLSHSMGAKTAWLVADSRPDLVKGIIAVEPAGPPFKGVGVNGQRNEAARYGITDAPITYEPEGPELKVCKVQPGHDSTTTTTTTEDKGRIAVLLQDDCGGTEEVKKLVNLRDIPVLVVTGEMSAHRGYDWGTVEFLRQAGVGNVEHVQLDDSGVRGNGHMLMMEGNRGEVGRILVEWMGRITGQRTTG